MLKKILSISGRPGLYRLISQGKNMLIVEGLADKRRFPVHARDRVISLGDIAIYTNAEEVALGRVFESIYAKYEGKALDAAKYKEKETLKEFFLEVLPDFDEDRVHMSDIKKVITWYNLLVSDGFTKFVEEEEKPEAEEKAAE